MVKELVTVKNGNDFFGVIEIDFSCQFIISHSLSACAEYTAQYNTIQNELEEFFESLEIVLAFAHCIFAELFGEVQNETVDFVTDV